MIEEVKYFVVIAICLIVLFSLAFFDFVLQRKVHYNLFYDSVVDEAIEERIVPLEKRIQELENAQKVKNH